MDLDLNKFDKIISLGTTCTFSFMFPMENFYRCIFDSSIVTPMWAVCQLISNNFEDFLSNVAYEKLYDGANGSGIYDKKYYIRTFGNNPLAPDYIAFCDIMKNKSAEFMETLRTATGNILFLRHAEVTYHKYYGNRLNHPDFVEYFAKPELDYVKDFSNIIKNLNPNIKFKILFMSDVDECFTDDEHNIIGIPDHPHAEFMNKDLHAIMKNHINRHCEFLSEKLFQ